MTLGPAIPHSDSEKGPDDALGHVAPGFLGWVAQLVQSHRHRLLGSARRQGLDPEEALDAVQDSFIAFLGLPDARAIADAPDDALKLLSVLVRHRASNQRRKRVRRTRAQVLLEAELASDPVDAEGTEALIARAEELARARGCILRMTAVQQRVILLSLLEEKPHDEIASVLGISDGHARVLLHRARAHVRRCAEDDWEELQPHHAQQSV